jgi:hypothetical protein
VSKKQTFARYSEDDVLDALRDAVGPETSVCLTPRCTCGCDAVIGYARDARALWLFPQLWPEGLKPCIYGLETRDELERLLARMKDKHQVEVVGSILREAFESMSVA